MKLTSENVEMVFKDCLWSDAELEVLDREEIGQRSLKVRGVSVNIGFNPERIEKNKDNITNMLSQLPKEFKKGQSVLVASNNSDGERWTSLHIFTEQLVSLGLAIGRARFCAPRAVWHLLPGRMPYLMVTETSFPPSPHDDHGRGNEGGAHEHSDCPCTGTSEFEACAVAGCGFCIAALFMQVPETLPV